MVLGGLWHGASANFVIWGAINGIALVIYKNWKKISPYENRSGWMVHFWKIFITFNFITFSRIWFRLKAEDGPLKMLNQIWNEFNFDLESFSSLWATYQPAFLIMMLGFFVHWMPQSWKTFMVEAFTKTHRLVQMAIITVFVVVLYQAASDSFQPFVYLEF
jgi:D-alanyl-lipoteichoic acid acyltransferase DltB (MBOAT superfamily)